MIEITKRELRNWYYNMTLKELAAKLGVSQPTVLSLIKSCKIPLRGSGTNPGGPRRIIRRKIKVVKKSRKKANPPADQPAEQTAE